MKSTRLPGKIMMPVAGKPLMGQMADRIRASKYLDLLVVATTDQPEDDIVEEYCNKEGIEVFRGSEDDVLDRIYKCALKHGMEHVARYSGDNPLIDPVVSDRILKFYIDNIGKFDYVSNNHPPTFPDGQEVEVMPFAVLERAWRESDKPFQREHGTPYIWDQPEVFRIANVESEVYYYDKHRWTLDYQEDFEFTKRIYEELYPKKKIFTSNDIFELLKSKPELMEINSKHKGYTWYKKEEGNLKTVK